MVRSEPIFRDLVKSIADEIVQAYGHGRTIVAVDGRHGAGQQEFAEGLGKVLAFRGLKVFNAHLTDFFHARSYRERSGRVDGEAIYRDAFDYSLLKRVLIEPFRTSGSTSFVLTGFDERRDAPVFQPKWMSAGPDAILIIDGVFLQRPELSGIWNYTIWLSTDSVVTQPEGVDSDELYLVEAKPREAATTVIDNRDSSAPVRVFIERI